MFSGGGITAQVGAREPGRAVRDTCCLLQGGQRVLGTCTLLQLHAPYRHGHEPERRPPKAFFGIVSLTLHLIPAPVVSLPSPGAPAHAGLWRHQHCRFCVVLPSRRPQLTEALSAFPGYLHLLQMSFARDVQFYLQSL